MVKEKQRYGPERLFIGPRFGAKVVWGKKETTFVDDTGIIWVKNIESNDGEEKSEMGSRRRNGRNGKTNTSLADQTGDKSIPFSKRRSA